MDLEKNGIPTVLITTTSFNGLAKMEARAFGFPDVALLVVPHPVGAGLLADQVIKKADKAMEALVKLLTAQS